MPQTRPITHYILITTILFTQTHLKAESILKQKSYKEYASTSTLTRLKMFSIAGLSVTLTTDGTSSTLYHENPSSGLTTTHPFTEEVTGMASDIYESHFVVTSISGKIYIVNKFSGVFYKTLTTVDSTTRIIDTRRAYCFIKVAILREDGTIELYKQEPASDGPWNYFKIFKLLKNSEEIQVLKITKFFCYDIIGALIEKDGKNYACTYDFSGTSTTISSISEVSCLEVSGVMKIESTISKFILILHENGHKITLWNPVNNLVLAEKNFQNKIFDFSLANYYNDAIFYIEQDSTTGLFTLGFMRFFSQTEFKYTSIQQVNDPKISFDPHSKTITISGRTKTTNLLTYELLENFDSTKCETGCYVCDADVAVGQNCYLTHQGSDPKYNLEIVAGGMGSSVAAAGCPVINFNGVCISSCPKGFGLKSGNLCEICQKNFCEECYNDYLNECTKCIERYYIDSGVCIECPAGKYVHPGTLTCENCNSPCAECNSSADTCTKCSSGYLESGSCVAECPQGKYADETKKECFECESPCFECQTSPLSCTSCRNGFFFESGACVSKCPDSKTFDEGNFCVDCESEYFENFGNCFQCVKKQELECVEPYNFEFIDDEEINFEKGVVEILITPSLFEKFQEDDVKKINFSENFEIEILNEKNKKILDVDIINTIGEKDEKLKTVLKFNITTEEIILNSETAKYLKITSKKNTTLLKSQEDTRQDPDFAYIKPQSLKKILKFSSKNSDSLLSQNSIISVSGKTTNPNEAILIGIIIADPTGMMIKASQIMEVVNRYVFLNIEFTGKLKEFLEICAKVEKIDENDEKFKNDRGKFGVYFTPDRLEGRILIICLGYLASWILKFFEKKIVEKLKKKNYLEVGKWEILLLKLLRKVKLSIFISLLPEILFFGLKIFIYSKLNIASFVDRVILLVVFILLGFDFYLIFKNIKKILKFPDEEMKPFTACYHGKNQLEDHKFDDVKIKKINFF